MVPNLVLLDERLDLYDRALYTWLAHYARQDEDCYPGQERLHEKVGCSVRRLRDSTRKLEDAGYLSTQRMGRGHTNRYLLLIPDDTHDRQEVPVIQEIRPAGGAALDRQEVPVHSNEDTENKDAVNPCSPQAEFEDWIEHHINVTDNRAMTTPNTKARANVEGMWAERRREYPHADLKLVSIGAMANSHRRKNSYTDAQSVLRPMAVPKLLREGQSSARATDDWDAAGIQARARAAIEEDAARS